MSIGTWIVVGLLTGFLVSKLVIRKATVLSGISPSASAAPSPVAGLCRPRCERTVGLDVFGLVVTLAGAAAALIVYHMFFPHVRQG